MNDVRTSGSTPLRLVSVILMLGSLLVVAPRPASAALGAWSRTGPPAGEIGVLAVDPINPQVLYAGDIGVFKSVDAGAHWADSSAGLPPDMGVFAIAIRPDQPNTVFIAGEWSQSSGVFRSSDGGAHWENSVVLDSATLGSLAIDPSDPDTMYAGGDPVYRTVDGGVTWHPLAGSPDNVQSLAIDPEDTLVLYVATQEGVFKTSDGGGSWTEVRPLPGSQAWSVAIDPSDASNVYVGTGDWGLIRSTDAGLTWTQLDVPGQSVVGVTIEPSDPPRIYAVTSGGLAVSDDGGGRWKRVTEGLPGGVGSVVLDPVDPTIVYGTTAFWGGVFKSTDRGESWFPAVTGLATGCMDELAIVPGNRDTVYAGGSQLLTSPMFKTSDGAKTWDYIGTGLEPGKHRDIEDVEIDPVDPNTVWVSTGSLPDLYRSDDGGKEWEKLDTGINHDLVDLAIDPSDPDTLFGAAFGGVYRSVDGGGSWQLAPFQPPYHWVASVAVDPTRSNIVWAGTSSISQGAVFKSSDQGKTWAKVYELPNGDLTAAGITIDPGSPDTVYVPVAGSFGEFLGVLKTTDGGATWDVLQNGLPEASVTSVVLDPNETSTLYAGTSKIGPSGRDKEGVYASEDGGATWNALNKGLTAPEVHDLELSPVTSTLYAATCGGVFEYQIP